MQSDYPAAFTREHGCTEAQWLAQLPGAVGGAHWQRSGASGARITLGGGSLTMAWEALPPRRIAQVSIPRLSVRYRFDAVSTAERHAFMRYFDLYIQKGGG